MTTIIIIVVVALVFFVTICVVTFMVWKREAEMRTDSIKAIENSLGEVLDELAGDQAAVIRNRAGKGDSPYDDILQEMHDMQQEIGDKIKKESDSKAIKKRNHDPFGWVKSEPANKKETDRNEPKPDTTDNADDNAAYVKKNTNNRNKKKQDADDESGEGGNAEAYEDLTVFKPIERKPRRLKWVEVFEENSENAEPENPEKSEYGKSENSENPKGEKPPEDAKDAEAPKEPQEEAFRKASRKNSRRLKQQHFDKKPQQIPENTEEAWDFDEDEPDLWDFDEISRHISEDSEQHAADELDDLYEFEEEFEEIEELLEDEAAAIEEKSVIEDEIAVEDEIASKDGIAIEDESATEEESAAGEEMTAEPVLTQADDELFDELMNLPRQPDGESDIDFMDSDGMEELADGYQFEHFPKPPTGYNIGKSGKEYTVSELEILIKE